MVDVPSVKDYLWPIMQVMARAGEPIARREYAEIVADVMGLTAEQRQVRIPSGKHLTFRHRVGWATTELKHAGFVHSPAPGLWGLTDEGRRFAAEHPNGLSADDITEIRRRAREEMKRASDDDTDEEPTRPAADPEPGVSPEEQIGQALAALRESVATDLLQRLAAGDPAFFERVVLDVLHAMGYGASPDDLQQVGGSGDGGIDGVISLDRLGLEKVYVQAKRWQGNVGRPEIQSFVGALDGRRANKGVFMTTSGFTREAREYAAFVANKVALVNGRELAKLMIECGVGVSRRQEYVPEIDTDYFTDD